MSDALLEGMRPLRRYERVFLKALGASFAVLGAVGVIAASCLERNGGPSEAGIVETTSGVSTINDSTGGPVGIDDAAAPAAPSESEPAGTTTLTSAQIDEETDAGPRAPLAGHADHESYDPNARPEPPLSSWVAGLRDGGAEEAPSTASAATSAAPADAGVSGLQAVDGGFPPPAPQAFLGGGAGPFLTEPPPNQASAMTPNPEAGAGPFTTERPWPPGPVVFGAQADGGARR